MVGTRRCNGKGIPQGGTRLKKKQLICKESVLGIDPRSNAHCALCMQIDREYLAIGLGVPRNKEGTVRTNLARLGKRFVTAAYLSTKCAGASPGLSPLRFNYSLAVNQLTHP